MAKFQVIQTEAGFHFNLLADNGQVVALSEVYTAKSSCTAGVQSVKNAAPAAGVEDQTVEGYAPVKHPKFEVYADKSGKFRFRLKAVNGEILCAGRACEEKQDVLDSIEDIKDSVAEAEIAE